MFDSSSNQQFTTEIGNVNPILNDTYNDLGKFLQYCVDNGYLPDINIFPLIPIMTSNTLPEGEAFATSASSGNEAYKMFDGSMDTMWGSSNGNQQIYGYGFSDKKIVKKIEFHNTDSGLTRVKSFEIVASNDKTSWTVLHTGTATSNLNTVVLNNNTAYKYYAVRTISLYNWSACSYMQMYGKL